jgi:general secretion pathway protein E
VGARGAGEKRRRGARWSEARGSNWAFLSCCAPFCREKAHGSKNGIFLVAGPTGSGKTNTLYTALTGLDAEARKIVTVEDPIEYSLPGINQVQVEPQIDMSFARALRAILRQDPDVVMVGEIRDQETAEIAVRAALMGRMVLSTIHTNDSVSAVTRLLDLGVPGFLLAATLRGVLSQRLMPVSCEACNGAGCAQCGETGRAGRQVVSELLEVGSGLAQAITEGAPLAELERVAEGEGFCGIRQ